MRNRVKDAGGSHENPPAIRTGDAPVSTASFSKTCLTKEQSMVIAILTFSLAVAVLIAAREQRRGRTLERLLQQSFQRYLQMPRSRMWWIITSTITGFVIGGCRGPDAQRLAEAQAHAREQTRVSEQQPMWREHLLNNSARLLTNNRHLRSTDVRSQRSAGNNRLIAEAIALSMELMLCSLPLVLVLMLLGRRSLKTQSLRRR